jgi:hypothetical protein
MNGNKSVELTYPCIWAEKTERHLSIMISIVWITWKYASLLASAIDSFKLIYAWNSTTALNCRAREDFSV